MSIARTIYELLARRAVYTVAAIEAGLAMLVAFGLDWTAEQVAAVVAFTSAVLSLVFGQSVQRKPPN